METSAVETLLDQLPNRYRALAVLSAGAGLRQGELFGLSPHRIDFLRRPARAALPEGAKLSEAERVRLKAIEQSQL